MLRSFILFSLFWSLSLIAPAQRTISGFVTDAATGESLPGANVYSGASGTITNNYGFYSLAVSDTAHYITVSYVGYETQQIKLKATGSQQLKVALQSGQFLNEIVVKAIPDGQKRNQGQLEMLRQKVFKVPTMLGEPDIFKSVQMYPGINFGTEGTVDLHVRGGDKDQNLVLLDDVVLYNTGHTGGFFSNINSEFIKRVKVYTGGFPARYSGRVASVLDIRTREGSTTQTNMGFTISPLLGNLFFETPVIRNKSALLVSARRSMFDIILGHIEGAPPYRFFDTNLKYHHELSSTNHLYFTFYHGRDAMNRDENDGNFTQTEELNYGNTVAALRWNHLFGERMFMNNSLAYSQYRFFYGNHSESTATTANFVSDNVFQTETKEIRLKTDFEYMHNNTHTIRFGLNAARMLFAPENRFKASDLDQFTERADTILSTQNTTEASLYLEDQINLKQLEIQAGINLISYLTGQKTYVFPEPRVKLTAHLSKSTDFTASYSRMSQNVHLLTHTGPLLPEDIWFPSSDSVPPVDSHQVATGISWKNNTLEISLEGYYKKLKNLTEKRWDSSGKSPLALIEIGTGRAYGAEIMLQYHRSLFDFTASYTYSRTFRTFEAINFGKEYRGTYDRPHNLKILLQLKLSKSLSINNNFTYKSGHLTNIQTALLNNALNYISLPIYQSGFSTTVDYYDERNGYRLPDYLRWDVDISYQFGSKKQHQLKLGAYNITNHHNAVSVQATPSGVYSSSLWGFFPYISYGWRLHP